MWSVRCGMLECWMWNVGCEMMDAECGIWNGACGTGSPTDRSSTQKPCGLLYQKTPISPMRTDGSFHGLFTLAPLPTAWGLMRLRRKGSPRIFSMRKVR